MRTPRIALLGIFLAASIFIFTKSVNSYSDAPPAVQPQLTPRSSFRAFFSWSGPLSLWPPNAAITLTDDNTTYFAARPAAFGPPLPSLGLSGQLWIGKGIPEHSDRQGEGELGCTDVPGYEDRPIHYSRLEDGTVVRTKGFEAGIDSVVKKKAVAGRDSMPAAAKGNTAKEEKDAVDKDDGTDDYLQQGLLPRKSTSNADPAPRTHADIETMQEMAEITGKVAMLSRGGCGFLEKVKWAQRRGATAVIVADNQKGAPLIQMFATGDTSNIVIPAIFTSRTTAQLLSTLMQPGSYIEDIIDEHGNPVVNVGHHEGSTASKDKTATDRTTTATATIATSVSRPASTSVIVENTVPKSREAQAVTTATTQPGWLARLFGVRGEPNVKKEDGEIRQAEESAHDWVLVDDFNDADDQAIQQHLEQAARRAKTLRTGINGELTYDDGFDIGKQDWRDPDMVSYERLIAKEAAQRKKSGKSEGKSHVKTDDYAAIRDKKAPKTTTASTVSAGAADHGFEILDPKRIKADKSVKQSKDEPIRSVNDIPGTEKSKQQAKPEARPQPTDYSILQDEPVDKRIHEGLWVTITPTANGSPVFDTLVVIVISPLITLTIVYSLLIIRAKWRRRRWRAPKSVVERLPVRTYHTVPTSSNTSRFPSRLPSPSTSTPSTPVLSGATRPRSRTTSCVPQAGNLLSVSAPAALLSRPVSRSGQEKAAPSQWKKYMGRQVECVVCLEEYIDGISRVMSLPCGHEFHAECITPWLTTRRRTCPICKGDVVRSLARNSGNTAAAAATASTPASGPSSPHYQLYHDTTSNEDLASLANSHNGNNHDDEDALSPSRGGLAARTRAPSSYEAYHRAMARYNDVETDTSNGGASFYMPPPMEESDGDDDDGDFDDGRAHGGYDDDDGDDDLDDDDLERQGRPRARRVLRATGSGGGNISSSSSSSSSATGTHAQGQSSWIGSLASSLGMRQGRGRGNRRTRRSEDAHTR